MSKHPPYKTPRKRGRATLSNDHPVQSLLAAAGMSSAAAARAMALAESGVHKAARRGDRVSLAWLRRAASALGYSVSVVVRRKVTPRQPAPKAHAPPVAPAAAHNVERQQPAAQLTATPERAQPARPAPQPAVTDDAGPWGTGW